MLCVALGTWAGGIHRASALRRGLGSLDHGVPFPARRTASHPLGTLVPAGCAVPYSFRLRCHTGTKIKKRRDISRLVLNLSIVDYSALQHSPQHSVASPQQAFVESAQQHFVVSPQQHFVESSQQHSVASVASAAFLPQFLHDTAAAQAATIAIVRITFFIITLVF